VVARGVVLVGEGGELEQAVHVVGLALLRGAERERVRVLCYARALLKVAFRCRPLRMGFRRPRPSPTPGSARRWLP
jgi:hypothetical protein